MAKFRSALMVIGATMLFGGIIGLMVVVGL